MNAQEEPMKEATKEAVGFGKADLRRVFEACDHSNQGSVQVAHLIHLAGHYLGATNNNLEALREYLRGCGDVITFPMFCHVFGAIAETDKNSKVCQIQNESSDLMLWGDTKKFEVGSTKSDCDAHLSFPVESKRAAFNHHTRMPIEDRASPSSMSELDSALGTNTTSPASGRKSRSGCSSMSDREEESFVCFGENEDIECDSDSSPVGGVRDAVDGDSMRSPPSSLPPSTLGVRNSWVRRSLRGSPIKNSESLGTPKRWGSFRHAPRRAGGTAVASHLYRTSSFSSGRSSAPDPDDMYSDASLEDDMLDLNQKVHMLQQQVGVLAENQVNTDDRYTRAKQDNSALQARVMMLEEQLRDSEIRAEERLAEEQKRHKELMARVEREKQLTMENCSMKLASAEKDKTTASEEIQRMKMQLEKIQKEKSNLEDRLAESEFSFNAMNQENIKMTESSRRDKEELRIERERGSQVIEELRCEVERLRAVEESYRKRSPSVDSASGCGPEVAAELKAVKEEKKQLIEQVEDLQAQLLTSRLEEGRTLITNTSNSLAAEFEQMNNDELRQSLKDSQEANDHLRSYIDDILLNIVENYPQLLEVKQK